MVTDLKIAPQVIRMKASGANCDPGHRVAHDRNPQLQADDFRAEVRCIDQEHVGVRRPAERSGLSPPLMLPSLSFDVRPDGDLGVKQRTLALLGRQAVHPTSCLVST